jgi:copper chaperone CopZ
MAVRQLPGTGTISGEVTSRTVCVEYDPEVIGEDAIREALRRVGYESTPLGESHNG